MSLRGLMVEYPERLWRRHIETQPEAVSALMRRLLRRSLPLAPRNDIMNYEM